LLVAVEVHHLVAQTQMAAAVVARSVQEPERLMQTVPVVVEHFLQVALLQLQQHSAQLHLLQVVHVMADLVLVTHPPTMKAAEAEAEVSLAAAAVTAMVHNQMAAAVAAQALSIIRA
jgi:hypothetical protein